MKQAICHLKSLSPYGQSRKVYEPKLPEELNDAYEKRTWREKAHYDESENIIIPPMQFANSLKEAAKYLSIQIPGKGKATFTKNFEAGVMVTEPVILPIKKKDVKGLWLFVPADGRRGSGKRVDKCFPVIDSWEGTVTYNVIDDIITEEVFRKVLIASGSLIGIGFFRPRNCGYYGRFECDKMEWIENV